MDTVGQAYSIAPPDARGTCPVCRGLGPVSVWLQCYGHLEPPTKDCLACGRAGILVRVVAAPIPERSGDPC